jgi:hypothetical protein
LQDTESPAQEQGILCGSKYMQIQRYHFTKPQAHQMTPLDHQLMFSGEMISSGGYAISATISRKSHLAAFILLGSSIFVPRLHLGEIAVGLDDMLSPLLLGYLFMSPIFFGKSHVPLDRLFLLWLLLILHGIVFGLFGSLLYLDKLIFPS